MYHETESKDFKIYYGGGDGNVTSKWNFAQSKVFRGYFISESFTSYNVGEVSVKLDLYERVQSKNVKWKNRTCTLTLSLKPHI